MRVPFEGMLAARALRGVSVPLVVSIWGNDFTLFAAGSPQIADYQPSFVDGIGAKTVFPRMLERAQKLLDGLGTRFNILKLYFKAYPTCRWNQAALDGVRQVMARRNWKADDIDAVEVGVARALVDQQFEDYAPHNLVDAQFSTPYAVALILHGEKAGRLEPSRRIMPQAMRSSLGSVETLGRAMFSWNRNMGPIQGYWSRPILKARPI